MRRLHLAILAVLLAACGNAREPMTVTAVAPSTSSSTAIVPSPETVVVSVDGQPRVFTLAEYRRFRRLVEHNLRAAWYGAVARNAAAALAARQEREQSTSPAAAPSSAARRRVTTVIPDQLVAFFECVIDHESGSAGVYSAVNASGKYRGAYQMDASFWRAYAPAEWKHLADTASWETAPPEVQDQTALNGYAARGPAPWMGVCTEYAA